MKTEMAQNIKNKVQISNPDEQTEPYNPLIPNERQRMHLHHDFEKGIVEIVIKQFEKKITLF